MDKQQINKIFMGILFLSLIIIALFFITTMNKTTYINEHNYNNNTIGKYISNKEKDCMKQCGNDNYAVEHHYVFEVCVCKN